VVSTVARSLFGGGEHLILSIAAGNFSPFANRLAFGNGHNTTKNIYESNIVI
jgi:hypothetical protein